MPAGAEPSESSSGLDSRLSGSETVDSDGRGGGSRENRNDGGSLEADDGEEDSAGK